MTQSGVPVNHFIHIFPIDFLATFMLDWRVVVGLAPVFWGLTFDLICVRLLVYQPRHQTPQYR